mgnify:CR=1 FL=1
MATQTQTQQIRSIERKMKKIYETLEQIAHEIDNLSITSYDELKMLDELLHYHSRLLLEIVLDINSKLFNMYWDQFSQAGSDIDEDVEQTYIERFVEFIEKLKYYSVEGLCDYIRNHYCIEEEEKSE